MCHVSESSPFNLSQESLTSPAALQVLKWLLETDPTFWSILMKNEAMAPNVKHPNYDGAEDNDPNEENAALKYEDNHFIPSDILRNHILHGDVAQHGGLESEKGDIIPLSISETINNDAADTEHGFENLNNDVPPPQDLLEQPDDPLAQKAADTTTTSITVTPLGAQAMPPVLRQRVS
jgi:hypothetical protein